MNLPVTHEGYTPDPGTAFRPAFGGGIHADPRVPPRRVGDVGPVSEFRAGGGRSGWGRLEELRRDDRGLRHPLQPRVFRVPRRARLVELRGARSDRSGGRTHVLCRGEADLEPAFLRGAPAPSCNNYPFIRPVGGPVWSRATGGRLQRGDRGGLSGQSGTILKSELPAVVVQRRPRPASSHCLERLRLRAPDLLGHGLQEAGSSASSRRV